MDLSILPAFYSPVTGLNVNLLIATALGLLFARGLFLGLGDKFSVFILKKLNKLPIFENTDLDESLFATLGSALKTKMLAKQHEAQEIKTKYFALISEALANGDTERVKLLSKEKKHKLEELTHSIVTDFQTSGEGILWTLLLERYGNHAEAAKWVYDKIKSLVEQYKDPDHPSTSVLIVNHSLNALGELGNALSKGKESGA